MVSTPEPTAPPVGKILSCIMVLSINMPTQQGPVVMLAIQHAVSMVAVVENQQLVFVTLNAMNVLIVAMTS